MTSSTFLIGWAFSLSAAAQPLDLNALSTQRSVSQVISLADLENHFDGQATPYGWLFKVSAGTACPAVDGLRTGSVFDVGARDCPYRNGGPCPASTEPPSLTVPEWIVNGAGTALLSAPANPATLGHAPISKELARYCLVRDPAWPQYLAAGAPVAGEWGNPYDASWVEQGVVVGTQSFPNLEAWMQTVTRDEIGTPTLPSSPAGSARLVLLDTTRSGPPRSFVEGHADALVDLLPHLGSHVTVRHRMAMPMTSLGPNELVFSEGSTGTYGSLIRLAQGIVREVDEWLTLANPNENLVLNLSLAWHGRLTTADADPGNLNAWGAGVPSVTDPWRLDVEAVHDALEYAVCNGALVVVASGNRTGGPHIGYDSDPVFPAAWADHEVTASRCMDVLALGPAVVEDQGAIDWDADVLAKFGTAPSVPLVYAIGGVGRDGHALALSRVGRVPALHAFAQHAMGPSGEVLTGTSVAAAIVSARAALRWNDDPTLSAAAVMADLYATGCATQMSTLGIQWDPRVATATPLAGSVQARRIKFGGCAGTTAIAPSPDPAPAPVPVSLFNMQPGVALLSSAEGAGLTPFVHQTPDPVPCPICEFDDENDLALLAFQPPYDDMQRDDLTFWTTTEELPVTFNSNPGSEWTAWSLDDSGEAVQVFALPIPYETPITRALITFVNPDAQRLFISEIAVHHR